jgi:peroxiredoxin
VGRLAILSGRWRGRGIVLAAVILFVAWMMGTYAGRLTQSLVAGFSHQSRDEMTRGLLSQMNTIHVGEALPDFSFEDLDGNRLRLSELVTDSTLLAIVDLSCAPCVAEMKYLAEAADGSNCTGTILISSSNPLHFKDFRDSIKLPSRVLFDEDRAFQSNLKIASTPFNLNLGPGLVVYEAWAASLTPKECRRSVTCR